MERVSNHSNLQEVQEVAGVVSESKSRVSLEEMDISTEKSRKVLFNNLESYIINSETPGDQFERFLWGGSINRIVNPLGFANYLGIGVFKAENLTEKHGLLGLGGVDNDGKNVIYVDKNNAQEKNREIILYEIANFLLMPEEKRHKSETVYHKYPKDFKDDDINNLQKVIGKFVREALMPKDSFIEISKRRNLNKTEYLATRFGVTYFLAKKRVEELGL